MAQSKVMGILNWIILITCLFFLAVPLAAQNETEKSEQKNAVEVLVQEKSEADSKLKQAKEEGKAEAQAEENYNNWKGMGFGVAIGLTIPFKRIIDSAELVNDIVRIKSEKTALGHVLLETHYFIPLPTHHEKPIQKRLDLLRTRVKENKATLRELKDIDLLEKELAKEVVSRKTGLGPFIAILPGTDKVLKAIGAGILWGIRRGDTSSSLNIGLGYINYSEMTVLADGVRKNELVPTNVKDLIKTTNSHGLIILFSFSF